MEAGINRKIILAVAGVLLILLAGGVYLLFLRSNSANNQSNTAGGDSTFPTGDNRDVPSSTGNNFPPLKPVKPSNNVLTTNTTTLSTTNIDGSPDLFLTGGKFKNLVPEPVASAIILPEASSSIVYLEQASGNLYKTSFLGENKERLSFTTISNSRQFTWGGTIINPLIIIGQDGLTGLDFNSFKLVSGDTSSTSTLSQLVGSSTPSGYYTFTANPTKTKIFSLKHEKDGASINLSDFSFIKPERVGNLAFGDWRLNWFKDDLVALETRPSSLLSGSLYFFNLKTKSLDKILGGINGLIAKVSSDGNYIIYSGTEGDRLSTYLYNLKTKDKTLLIFSTLADKCAWASNNKIFYCAVPKNLPRGQYPDSWYKGLISTTDDFWQVDIASTTTKIIADTGTIGVFDVYHPFLDYEGETLFFINKKDLSLWSFDVREGF